MICRVVCDEPIREKNKGKKKKKKIIIMNVVELCHTSYRPTVCGSTESILFLKKICRNMINVI